MGDVIFDELELWEDREFRSAAMNMACDEALLRCCGGRVVLRVYRWGGEAVTFGYARRIAEVRRVAEGREAMRRWTGGGIVEHGDDWTLGLVVPKELEIARLGSAEIYRRLHAGLLRGLAGILEGGKLAAGGAVGGEGICFAEPVANDILVGGRKVLGGALRRTAQGVLYQGSLIAGGTPGAMGIAAALARRVGVFGQVAEVEAQAMELVREKYGLPGWLHKR